MNPLLNMQRAAKAGHFRTAIFYKKLKSLSVDKEDQFEDGSPFKYGLVTNETKLSYLGSHISIRQNDVVIETYANYDWILKSKIKLETGKMLQIQTATPFEEVISPVSRVIKWTLTLG